MRAMGSAGGPGSGARASAELGKAKGIGGARFIDFFLRRRDDRSGGQPDGDTGGDRVSRAADAGGGAQPHAGARRRVRRGCRPLDARWRPTRTTGPIRATASFAGLLPPGLTYSVRADVAQEVELGNNGTGNNCRGTTTGCRAWAEVHVDAIGVGARGVAATSTSMGPLGGAAEFTAIAGRRRRRTDSRCFDLWCFDLCEASTRGAGGLWRLRLVVLL